MSIKKRYKKITLSAALLSSIAITGAIASSCATVDLSNFKEVNASVISDHTKTYDELDVTPAISAKNLIYGTDAFNNGNYVLTVVTFTSLDQYEFINGAPPGVAGAELWNGEWSRAVTEYNKGLSDYPDGIKFLMYQDDQQPNDNGESYNPYAKYPKPADDSTASKEERNNAGKYRREDASAKAYRQIVDLIQTTYGSSVSNWINKDSGTTNKMVIAFKNNNGKVTPNFYNGSSSSDNSGDDSGGSYGSSSTTSNSSKMISQAVTIPTAFSSWLKSIYGSK